MRCRGFEIPDSQFSFEGTVGERGEKCFQFGHDSALFVHDGFSFENCHRARSSVRISTMARLHS